ncbi:serine/threonine-protein kinase [Streptomyces sp. NPDC015346]|uniref:serine/threonine-protein kinase n=1 Tax=Streptomyces sp. NPDC015346 TaxID=3364954 RepID=UPI003702681B
MACTGQGVVFGHTVRVGTLIGRYEVEHKLGEGGMGTVYLARSRGGRAVAVKVARPELASDPAFRARFRAEVEAARRVGGFHTAQVVDADPEAEAPWLATAYIPGPTLAGLVAAEGPLSEPRLRALGAALAEALEAIHACGLVHRDLKPGNIVMAADGPRVLDFGIARALESTRLTATGAAFGTPGYLAPEQALGEEVTGAADVFALGAVLVAAAGGRPFGDGTPMGLMYRTVHETPDLASVPAGLRGLVGACLAKAPGERPTPGEILDTLAGAPPLREGATPTLVVRDAAPVPVGDAGPAPVRDQAPPPVRDQAPPPVRDQAPPPVREVPPVPALPTMPAEPPPPAPALVAADGDCGVVADADGIRFEVFDEEAEFAWAEIGSVEYESARRGRQLRVVVTLYDGSAYDCEVNGRSALVKEWIAQLELVLRHCMPRQPR